MGALCHLIAVAALVSACIKSDSVVCGDLTCPAGTQCLASLCLSAEQATVCGEQSIDVGDRCQASGTPGICTADSLCIAGCGDGITNHGEECDDGNFRSHDGCSSRCAVEIASWKQFPSPWTGVMHHSAAYHAELGRLVVVGGTSIGGLRDEQWQRRLGGLGIGRDGWEQVAHKLPTRLPPRQGAAIAYDSARNVIVVFGGLAAAAGVLDETWEYRKDPLDTTDHGLGIWQKITPPTSPPRRFGAAMVFDPTRNRLVLFGGYGGSGPGNTHLGDTWEYDGTTWIPITSTPSPLGRVDAGMAWHVTSQRAVLFSGQSAIGISDDTWEYANGTWTQRTIALRPAPRLRTAMAYDPVRDKVVVFGGVTTNFEQTSDTWEYADGSWTEIVTAVQPPGRLWASLTFDPTATAVGALTLVGGSGIGFDGSPVSYDDVWQYESGTWKRVTPEFVPGPRLGSPLAYDDSREYAFVFGGFGTSGLRQDSWRFGDRFWSLAGDAPTNRPAPRFNHSVAYDRRRKAVVVVGGVGYSAATQTYEFVWPEPEGWRVHASPPRVERDSATLAYDGTIGALVLFGGTLNGVGVGDTWEFDGTAWRPGDPAGPAMTNIPAMAWDISARRLILFDGNGVTWSYDNHEWTERAPEIVGVTPPRRAGAVMAFDWERDRLVLVGGTAATGQELTDVWELDIASNVWSELYVPPGGPLPRHAFGLAGHRKERSIMFYSGTSGIGVTNDTWFLQWRSNTPDEVCGDDVDDDGDNQLDHEDPDCGVAEDCSNGTDEDFDSRIDGDDPECQL